MLPMFLSDGVARSKKILNDDKKHHSVLGVEFLRMNHSGPTGKACRAVYGARGRQIKLWGQKREQTRKSLKKSGEVWRSLEKSEEVWKSLKKSEEV